MRKYICIVLLAAPMLFSSSDAEAFLRVYAPIFGVDVDAMAKDAYYSDAVTCTHLGINPCSNPIKQFVAFEQRGFYTVDALKLTTSCVNLINQQIVSSSWTREDDLYEGADALIETLLWVDGWKCNSQIEIDVLVGEKDTFDLERCQGAKVVGGGTSQFVSVDIEYRYCGPPLAEQPSCGVLGENARRNAGHGISSCTGQYTLSHQTDGNVIICEAGNAI